MCRMRRRTVTVAKIVGEVVDDIVSNFMPRVFSVQSAKIKYTIVTYCWAFQSCVKNGDCVEITGNLHDDGKTVSLDEPSHGIKIF